MKVLRELRQRKVLQTAALYFAGAWGATEIFSYLIERIPIFPAWADTAIAILFVLGFPVTVFLAWMFDVGADGVRRANPASGMGRGVIVLSVLGLLAATGGLSYLIWPRVQAERGIAMGDLGTVAVLPFENLTGDPSLGYLGMGLSEDIRQRLAMFTDLKIIGRVSMAGFAMGGTDLASVRGLLDAGLVVEGSLQNPAGQMRVNIALLDTARGRQLWSNSFMATEAGWGPLRRTIVTSLAEQLEVTVRLQEQQTRVPNEALEAYLRALAELGQPKVADGWLAEAIRLAPDFADAWARRALLRLDMVWSGTPRDQAWAEGEAFLTRAREIEPDHLLAHIAEAELQWWIRLDPIASLAPLERAAARAPNHPRVLAGMGTALRYLPGRRQVAVDYHRRYVAQDPLNPDAHTRLGMTTNTIPPYDRALELDPHFMRAYDYKANTEFFFTKGVTDSLQTLSRKGRIEDPASPETIRCMVYEAADLLPLERAEKLLREAIRHDLGQAHAYCFSPEEHLVIRLAMAGRLEEARSLITEFAGQDIWLWEGTESMARMALAQGDGAAELSLLREMLGEERVEAFLQGEPDLQVFNFWIASAVARALIDAGRIGEGRRLAGYAAPIVIEEAGTEGYPTISVHAIALLAMSGDVQAALSYAEQIGPMGFAMFGRDFLTPGGAIPELADEPRWQSFLRRCEREWLEEVDEFDRLVASGAIELPFPID